MVVCAAHQASVLSGKIESSSQMNMKRTLKDIDPAENVCGNSIKYGKMKLIDDSAKQLHDPNNDIDKNLKISMIKLLRLLLTIMTRKYSSRKIFLAIIVMPFLFLSCNKKDNEKKAEVIIDTQLSYK